MTSRAVATDSAPPELTVFKPTVLDGLVTVTEDRCRRVRHVDRGWGRPSPGEGRRLVHLLLEVRETADTRWWSSPQRDGGGVAEKTVYAEIGSRKVTELPLPGIDQ
jgi:hypothetical protein